MRIRRDGAAPPAARATARTSTRVLCLLGAVVLSAATLVPSSAPAAEPDRSTLYLVTLTGTGTAGTIDPRLARPAHAELLQDRQDDVLDSVGAPEPTYRWTTALNGFAVELDQTQARALEEDPAVALVEPNRIRPLAAAPSTGTGFGVSGPRRGGADTVIGLIDTGIAPENPLFGALDTAPRPSRFGCSTAEGWRASDCTGKVVGAQWFVSGFGADAVRANASLSPRDTDGHGTAMASIAAGNSRIPVRASGERLGTYAGAAPDARLASYKACWAAPDPSGDGCATADVVSAIDRATAERVDVLSLSVGGPARIDTVERALLGATEAGIVVVAAAGNTGEAGTAAHPSPWVTTVGATIGATRRGVVQLADGTRLRGAMVSRRVVGPATLVLGRRAAAAGASQRQARHCAPGSLDAALVRDKVVLCERGGVGRVDKSRTVQFADGVAMVLVNTGGGSVAADLHSVPTVHLEQADGERLSRLAARTPDLHVTLEPAGVRRDDPRVAPFSARGREVGDVVKPDLVAPGTGLLGAVPSAGDAEWDVVTGTSGATAYTAGVAADLLARGQSSEVVHSTLSTSTSPVDAAPRAAGAGLLSASAARRPGLAYLVPPGAYRAWLERSDADTTGLNTPSVVLRGSRSTATREITNVSGRRLYFSSSAIGFDRDVQVTPAAVRLGAGESVTFRVRARTGGGSDSGTVEWLGATGTRTRIPVVLTP